MARRSRLPRTVIAAALLAALPGAGCGAEAHRRSGSGTVKITLSGARAAAPPSDTQPARGSSVRGRLLLASPVGAGWRGPLVLVVGAIHGNEAAGIAVVDRLRALPPPAGVRLWTLRDLNPDGVLARTRQNADGVDLNRNFPYRWAPAGRPGDQQYPGPRSLSEPESRFAWRLILRLRPAVTIWFHQPLGVVDESGGRVRIERRFAALAGLPLRRLTRYRGSVTGWQNHVLGGSAFVVELPAGPLPRGSVTRLAHAVELLAQRLGVGGGGS